MGHSYSHEEPPTPEAVRDGHPLGTSLPPTSYMDTTTSSPSSTSSPSYDDCTTRSCLYFTFSKESTLLFQNWRVESDIEFWMAMGGIVALSLLYEMVWYILMSDNICRHLVRSTFFSIFPSDQALSGDITSFVLSFRSKVFEHVFYWKRKPLQLPQRTSPSCWVSGADREQMTRLRWTASSTYSVPCFICSSGRSFS